MRRPLCIGVFAPSDPLTPQRLDAVRRQRVKQENRGAKIVFGPSIREMADVYDTPSGSARAAELMDLAERPDVDLLIGAWGGKTSSEILPYLDFERLSAAGTPIAGFSDVAVLSNMVFLKTGSPSIFGPNVFGKLDESRADLLALGSDGFHEGQDIFRVEELRDDCRWPAENSLSGTLIGGNIGTFTIGLAGCRLEFPPESLFFFETTSMSPAVMRQYLSALANSGVLGRAAGVIFGELPFARSGEDVDDFLGYVREFATVPVVHAPTFGHGAASINPAIPIGLPCEIDCRNRTTRLLRSWTVADVER